MKGFLDAVRERVLLFDGGMGSMLIAAGLIEGEAPDMWNLIRPDVLTGIHGKYLEAGADVIQTNTFGATPLKLASSCRGGIPDVTELNLKSVELARRAIDDFREKGGDREIYLAGDVGPTGQFFPPMGVLTAESARESFREQVVALDMGGVDLFLIETMYDLKEAVEAIRAVRDVTDKPIVCEMTMDRKKKGFFTLVGDTPAKAAEVLLKEGADMVGANCSITSGEMIDLAAEFSRATDAPLLFQPNAGKPEMTSGAAVYLQDPEDFAEDMMKMIDAGASAVGGCCGTSPDFISAMRRRLDKRVG